MGYRPEFQNSEFRRNKRHYLIPNEENKVVFYTYIRKNACSSFKSVMSKKAQSGELGKLSDLKKFRASPHSLVWDHAIFIYRDPFERAVSTFVNKFVDNQGNRDIFANFKAQTGKNPATATFRDFTKYLEAPFELLDPHAWPQKSHLAEIEYTHAIDIKHLSSTMAEILPSLAGHFHKKVNVTVSGGEGKDDLCDTPANQLSLCNKDNFKSLRPVLEVIYSSDVRMISKIMK